MEHEEGNFFIGLFWGTLFSIPLWIAILGWIQIISEIIKNHKGSAG